MCSTKITPVALLQNEDSHHNNDGCEVSKHHKTSRSSHRGQRRRLQRTVSSLHGMFPEQANEAHKLPTNKLSEPTLFEKTKHLSTTRRALLHRTILDPETGSDGVHRLIQECAEEPGCTLQDRHFHLLG